MKPGMCESILICGDMVHEIVGAPLVGARNRRAGTVRIFMGSARNNSSTGFTMVEILIASIVFVVLMVTVHSAFRAGVFGSRDIEENLAGYQSGRQVLDRVALDLRNSFVFARNETGFSGTNEEINFFSLINVFAQGIFSRKYAAISYKIDGSRLLRRSKIGKYALNNMSEVPYEEFASGVEMFSFNYGEYKAIEKEIEWKDYWNDTQALPVAVKVKLILNGKTKPKFEKTVFFPAFL